MKMLRQLYSLFRKRKLDADMAEEMRHHVELQTELNMQAGMSADDARYAALREFGNVASIQEQARDGRGWVWLEQIWKDAGFAVRSLGKARGFSLTVLGTLVVGIGVATVVFSLTSGFVLSPPYPQPEQLYLIGTKDKQGQYMPNRSGLHLQAFQEQVAAISEYAAARRDVTNILIKNEPVVATLVDLSGDCLRTLGVKPRYGRGFLPNEYQSGTNNVVILSDLFWRQHFSADPDVLGRKIVVGRQACTVVGVLAADQVLPPTIGGDVYRPLVFTADPANPFSPMLYIIGRLRTGVSVEQANAELASVKLSGLSPWAVAYLADQETVLTRPTDIARPETQWLMLVAAGLLYAMACLNAMNLLLVRLLGRQHELSVRLALGGSRWQIARLLMLEGIGLALLACITVSLLARWLFPPIMVAITDTEVLRHASYWDWRTLGCIAGLSLLACLVIVIVPLWRVFRAEINPSLKDGGRAIGGSRRLGRLRSGLVMLQAAFAVILLAGTGLMVRSFEKLRQVDLGFDPAGKVKVVVSFTPGFEPEPKARLELFKRLSDRLAALPGVREVSASQDALLIGNFWGTAQLQMPDGSYQPVAGSFVSENFLSTTGLTLKRGRWLIDKGVNEVVINETMARARFGNDDPVGQCIKLLVLGEQPIPVVGVVHDVKDSVRSTAGMHLYSPASVYPPNVDTFFLRMDRDPGKEFAGLIRHVIHEFDPAIIAQLVVTLNEVVDENLWAERNTFIILKMLSSIALGLAVVGVFTVIAYSVDRRRQEFGVRLALGAQPTDLHRLVMKRGVVIVALGILLGVAGALVLTRFMQSLLFETTPNDPLVYAGVAVLMLVAALLACWLPARRAAKADPVVALRAE